MSASSSTSVTPTPGPGQWSALTASFSNQAAQGHQLDVFGQDFNMDPLDYWNAKDIPGRTGMTQVKHVTGHLAFWDELRKRHPHLWIDSCASGGRRNDLETMRRSVPLLRSDYQFEPTGNQSQTYGISLWLPYFGTGVGPQTTNDGGWGPGQYVVRSSLAPSYASSVDAGTASQEDWALLRTMNEEFVRTRRPVVQRFLSSDGIQPEERCMDGIPISPSRGGERCGPCFSTARCPGGDDAIHPARLGCGWALPDRELRPECNGTVVRKEPDAPAPGDFAFGHACFGHRAIRAPVR